jgi:hypothetical protein
MSSPRPIPALLLFFSLVWLIPALACGSSSDSTPTFSQVTATRELSQVEVVAPTPTTIDPDRDLFVYGLSMSIVMDSFGEASSSLGTLFRNPQLLSNDWTFSVAAELVRIRQAYENATEITPPLPLQAYHAAVLNAFKKCDDATYLLVSGLDNFDATMMERAGSLLAECGSEIEVANQLLSEYNTPTSGQGVPEVNGTTVNANANLRAGPGTTFDVVGGVSAGDALTVVGRNEAGDWYKTADDKWIASFLVNNAPNNLPVTND